jgi:hypothetical protein
MNSRIRIAVIAGAALAVAGGGVAVAANQLSTPQQERQAIIDDAAKRLDVTPSALQGALEQAYVARIDAAQKAGTITPAQADEMKARLKQRGLPLDLGPGGPSDGPGGPGDGPGGFGRHGGDHHGHGPGGFGDAAAAYLGLTGPELHAQVEAGKSLAQVAKDRGKSVDGLRAAVLAGVKKDLDPGVKDGHLPADQAASLLERITATIDQELNEVHGPGGHPGGPGGMPMPGGAPDGGAALPPLPGQGA